MLGPGDGEGHALGDVVGGERLDVRVDLCRTLGVAAEAHEREVGLHQAGIDERDPDRPAEQVLAQRVREAAHRELRGHVQRRLLVRLTPGDRADVDDVAAVAEVREAQPRHAHEPVDVGLDQRLLVLLRALVEQIPPERQPRVVHEDVETFEAVEPRW